MKTKMLHWELMHPVDVDKNFFLFWMSGQKIALLRKVSAEANSIKHTLLSQSSMC